MKTSSGPLLALLLALWCCPQVRAQDLSSPELKPKLEAFASYRFGQPKKVLHEARMAAYRNTAEERVRQHHEQLLLAFVESEAAVDARREACLWLGHLGSPASAPALKRLLAQEDFADVAQIALDCLDDRADSPPSISTARSAFASEVRNSSEPLPLLTAAWRGEDEGLSRHAFELVREGLAAPQAAQWFAEHHDELSPPRQITAMQVLLDAGSPHRIHVITTLSREGAGEARQTAVRLLGFLQRQEDVSYLMDLYHGTDQDMAQSARQALLTLPLPLIQQHLVRDLQGTEPATQARAIELAELTRAAFATQALLAISRDENNPNRVAAIRSLGKVAPPAMLGDMIGLFIQSIGSPLEAPFKQALWDLARKQEDHGATQRLLQTHAAETKDKTSRKVLEVLGSRLDRLHSPKP